jgi:hypothetical protein
MDAYQYTYGDRPLEGYTIQRAAGRGGFGEVYYAVSDSGRQVALKAIQSYEQIELRGISQCMNLKSPHLVTVFDVKYNDKGRPFVIMEYVSGPSLSDLLKESPGGLGAQKAAFFLREIGKGLSYLHECGIVHRDLKPSNIFYENGYVKIGDYGLTKAISSGGDAGHTATVGTIHYMAPEIGTGQYDRTTDIYALGVVLYEILTGRLPFPGSDRSEVFRKHMSADPPLESIDEPFARVIRKALAKDPAERYRTVQEMVEDVFGAEHMRNSVSQFGPEELTMVAERTAQKMQDARPAAGAHQPGTEQPHRARFPREKPAERAWMAKPKVFAALALITLTVAAGSYFGISAYARYQKETLQGDVAEARKAAEAGNMKLVLDVIEKHPGNAELTDLRLVAFEKLQPTYLSIADRNSDRELDRLINRRVQTCGTMVWDLSPRKGGHLWSCIQTRTKKGDSRYLQLFFPKAAGTSAGLQKQGLVKGAQVQVYGFLVKVDKHLFSKDEYGLNPLEAWEIIDSQ